MIRTDRLVVSSPHYAFKRDTWQLAEHGGWHLVDAVWFKRKNGVLTATMGRYHPMVSPWDSRPTDGTFSTWIAAANDNRYGGDWLASWDGDALLSFDRPTPAETAERVAFLDGMLRGFPDIPAGYEGWYTFPRGAK